MPATGRSLQGLPGGHVRALCLGAAIGLALALGACGGSSGSDSSSTVGYVGAADLSKYKDGTPQRTVLSWWKAVQFGNASIARSYYAPRAAPPPAELQRELAAASNQFTGVPDFSSVEANAGKATLYFFVSRPGSSAPPRAASINLTRTAAGWRLADDEVLSQVVERVEASQSRGT
jgi:hypothetical protein